MNPPRLSPLFIGLPGAGKTTLANYVATARGMEAVSTDPLFREYRAIPSTSVDPRAAVMRHFLAKTATYYPEKVAELTFDAQETDAKGRCRLHDSTHFRAAYGRDVFRLFEACMLAYVERTGVFAGKIVDLSASALLREDNQVLFSIAQGYLPILVDAPHEQIVENLLRDYQIYCDNGKKAPIRGGFEDAFTQALYAADDPHDSQQRKTLLQNTATTLIQDQAARWMPTYRKLAGTHILVPTGKEDDLAMLYNQVMGFISAAAARRSARNPGGLLEVNI